MKFSVIVPVYNVKPYLRDCLDSVLTQTCADWECVCVDDGSTDGCAEVLDEYAAGDARFHVIHKVNEGVAIARNTALDVIKGEWFLFLDSDDVWSPTLLKTCESMAVERPDCNIMCFRYKHFGDAERCLWSDEDTVDKRTMVDIAGPFSRHWGRFSAFDKVYRRSVLGAVRQRPYCVGEDLLYLTECMLRCANMYVTSSVLYGYRDRAGSVMRTGMSAKKVRDFILSNRDLTQVLQESGRSIDLRTRKDMCNILIEDVAWQLSHLSRTDASGLFGVWYDALRVLAKSQLPYGFQMFRVTLLEKFPVLWRSMAWLPRWLKTQGVHG